MMPIFPMGDSGATLNFGSVLFTQGLNGNPTPGNFFHAYYLYPNTYSGGNNSPNADSQPIYVRPLFQHVHAVAWGC